MSFAYNIVDCRFYLSIFILILPSLVTQPTYFSLFSITLHRYDTNPFIFRIRCTLHLQSHSLVPNISAPTNRQMIHHRRHGRQWLLIISCHRHNTSDHYHLWDEETPRWFRNIPIAHRGSDQQSSILTMASSGALDYDLSQTHGLSPGRRPWSVSGHLVNHR